MVRSCFTFQGGNGTSSSPSPVIPAQRKGISHRTRAGHGATLAQPQAALVPSSVCCTPASATLPLFSLFLPVALSLFTKQGLGAEKRKFVLLSCPSQASK